MGWGYEVETVCSKAITLPSLRLAVSNIVEPKKHRIGYLNEIGSILMKFGHYATGRVLLSGQLLLDW